MPAFQVFGSNQPRLVVQVVAHRLRQALTGLAPRDVRPLPVLIPAAAVRDRLRDQLADVLGVCAGIDLLTPQEFTDTWLPRRLGLPGAVHGSQARWRIAQALENAPGLTVEAGIWDARRLALASRVLDALEACATRDPERTVAAWDRDEAGFCDLTHPFLRHCRSAWGGDPVGFHAGLRRAVATHPDLPPLVLAVTTPDLSPAVLDLLAALGRRTEVQAVLLQPVPGDWQDQSLVWRRTLGPDEDWGHPLLARWGIEHRAALTRFDAAGAEIVSEAAFFLRPTGGTRLALLQRGLSEGVLTPGSAPPDDSLVFQHAYGVRAQIEGLKHRLAPRLAAGDLHPHDIAIATPDPVRVGLLVAAIFASPGEGPVVPTDLARSPALDPARQLALAVLTLLPGRWTVSEVLALISAPAVVSAWDLERSWVDDLPELAASAGLRFGTDGRHRAAMGLPDEAAGTWAEGLTRLAWSRWLGADTEAVPLRGGLAPVAGMNAEHSRAARSLIDLVEPLRQAAAATRSGLSAGAWSALLTGLVAHLLRTTEPASQAALAQALGSWTDDLRAAGLESQVLSADLVAAVLDDPARRAPVSAGGMAVDTPANLRTGSWKVVALVGFDEGTFPRQATGRDVSPLIGQPGMPDPRFQDRAAVLDLVAAVQEILVVTWTGHDPATGEPCPPCPVVADLLAVARVDGPLEPTALGLGPVTAIARGPEGIWPSALRLAQAQGGPLVRRPLLASLPTESWVDHDLEELVRDVLDPPRALVRRLGIAPDLAEEAPEDEDQLDAGDGLERWQLRQDLLQALIAGRAVHEVVERWRAEGRLPRGAWGAVQVGPVLALAEDLHARHGVLLAGIPVRPVPVSIAGVVGGLPGCHPVHGPVVVRAGTVGPKDLLRAWILGLVAQAAGLPGAGVVIGEVKGVPVRRDLPPSRDPAGRLAQVLEFRSRIRARPVPLVPEVLAAWASAQEPEQRRELAWRAWNAGGTGRGPAQRPAARWLWGTDGDAFADLDDPLLEDLMALIVDPAWSAA